MASRPDFTENADRPLGPDDLADDQARSGQTTDPIDDPRLGGDPLEDDLTSDDAESLLEDEEDVVDAALTRLPPG